MIGKLQFMLENAGMAMPLIFICLVTPLFLISNSVREALRDPWSQAMFVLLPLLWILLIPWCAAFLDAMDIRHTSPLWAYWPLYVVLVGWPTAAVGLFLRARTIRFTVAIWTLANLPCCFWSLFVGGMAVSGTWI